MSNFPDGMSPNEIPGEREDAKNAYIQRHVDAYWDDEVMFSAWFLENTCPAYIPTAVFDFLMEFEDVMDLYRNWLVVRAEKLFEAGVPCPE